MAVRHCWISDSDNVCSSKLPNISFHCYEDDTQIYLTLNSQNQTNVTWLQNCLQNIKDYLACNFLQLNEETEITLFGPPHLTIIITQNINHLSTYFRPCAKNLL